jgi:hypothetical protein
MSVIIEGAPLHIALHDAKEDFLELTLAAHTVICCRVTPHQKALVVTMVKNEDKATLAIGDGGNDVSMIQEACVGVGIRGREGLQAARASDFSIGSSYQLSCWCGYEWACSDFSDDKQSFDIWFACFLSMADTPTKRQPLSPCIASTSPSSLLSSSLRT